MEQLPLLIGYVLAAIFAIAFLLKWRQSASASVYVGRASKEIDELRFALDREKTLVKDLTDSFESQRVRQSGLEKKYGQLQTEYDQMKENFKKQQAPLEQALRSAENKSENYRSQMEALTAQLSEINQEKRILKQELSEVHQQANDKVSKDLEKLKESANDWKHKFHDLQKQHNKTEKKLAATQAKLEELKPDEILKIKRRIRQYNKLYNIMRSKKELAEERAHNWEVALKQVASWIVQEKLGKEAHSLPSAIGPLVGMALEAINGSLIDETTPAGPSDEDHPELDGESLTAATEERPTENASSNP